jgi:hypothetical protein
MMILRFLEIQIAISSVRSMLALFLTPIPRLKLNFTTYISFDSHEINNNIVCQHLMTATSLRIDNENS